jgi:hypothetical protein
MADISLTMKGACVLAHILQEFSLSPAGNAAMWLHLHMTEQGIIKFFFHYQVRLAKPFSALPLICL